MLATINALSNTVMLEGLLTQNAVYLVGSTTGMTVTLSYDNCYNPNFLLI